MRERSECRRACCDASVAPHTRFSAVARADEMEAAAQEVRVTSCITDNARAAGQLIASDIDLIFYWLQATEAMVKLQRQVCNPLHPPPPPSPCIALQRPIPSLSVERKGDAA